MSKNVTNDTFSVFQVLLLGVLQGPILAPILFNIFINVFLMWSKNTEQHNFADDKNHLFLKKL